MEHLITDDNDTPYQPEPLVTYIILFVGSLVAGLGLWKAAEILGDVYQWSIG